MGKTVILTLVLSLMTACSLKVSDKSADPTPSAGQKLVLSDGTLTGVMDGVGWTPVYAIARRDGDGEYNVTLAGQGPAISCMAWMASQPSVSFTVPKTPGTYEWDRANPKSGSRIVNVIFPYKIENGAGATTVLPELSVIRLDSIKNGFLEGAVAARANGSRHSFDINGRFRAEVCP